MTTPSVKCSFERKFLNVSLLIENASSLNIIDENTFNSKLFHKEHKRLNGFFNDKNNGASDIVSLKKDFAQVEKKFPLRRKAENGAVMACV